MKTLLYSCTLLVLATSLAGAEVIQPVAVVSEEYVHNSATDTINNEGMNPPVQDGDGTGSALEATHIFHTGFCCSYISTEPGGSDSDFFASIAPDTDVDLVYDITGGGDTTVGGLICWQYEYTGSGLRERGSHARTIEVRLNTEAEGYAQFDGPAVYLTLLPVSDGDGDHTNDTGGRNSAQGFSLGELTGRYAQVAITDNYFETQGMTGGGDRVGLGEIRFSTEAIPQFWLDKAWLMVVHAHPDDEGIFFGGTLPYYTRALGLPTVQVDMTTGYLYSDGTQMGDSESREGELHEVARRYGLPTPPVFAFLQQTSYTATIDKSWDRMADYIEDGDDIAEGQERASKYLAEQIRLYRPEVIASHDFGGEYGHPDHKAVAYATAAAWDLAAGREATIDDGVTPIHTITPDGIAGDPWEAKKVYIHNFDQNRLFHDHWEEISIDSDDDGVPDQTPREVGNYAMEAYVSQGQPHVATVYDPLANGGSNWDNYPSELWGLYASTVGPDTVEEDFIIEGQFYSGWARGDFLENIPLPTPTVSAGLSCLPSSGTVPFQLQITVVVTNNNPDQSRRLATQLNVTLADGRSFSNWRSGFRNMAPGEVFQTNWGTPIPAFNAVIGQNTITMVSEDVTPFPYNQPPYPPSGDTDTDLCSVEGIAP